MEFTALIEAFKRISEDARVPILMDSGRVVAAITGWPEAWKARGLHRAGQPLDNLDLIQEAYALASAHGRVEPRWIPRHRRPARGRAAPRSPPRASEVWRRWRPLHAPAALRAAADLDVEAAYDGTDRGEFFLILRGDSGHFDGAAAVGTRAWQTIGVPAATSATTPISDHPAYEPRPVAGDETGSRSLAKFNNERDNS